MTISSRVAKERKRRKITQETLAKTLGVSTPFISQIENGQKQPSYSLLLKMASYFDVSIDYFFGTEREESRDPSSRFIESAFRILDKDTRLKVIDYVFQLSSSKRFENMPFLSLPTEYAQYLVKEYCQDTLPVDPAQILSNLETEIIYSQHRLGYEAILYKNPETSVIVIDPEIDNPRRIRFSLAMMLGHLVIPWHLKASFTRAKKQTSLKEENQLGIEAREFAAELLMPSSCLKEDFKRIKPALESLEELAYGKYDVALVSLGHKFVQMSSKDYTLFTSSDRNITRTYAFKSSYRFVEQIQSGSLAESLYDNPSDRKEIRKGYVDAEAWVIDPPKGLKVYEESLLDPERKTVITLLKLDQA